ncbi:MAG: hypothetical protein GVY18_16700 [Bacteroidetes bacterium]|nr:hypothetical protein [Bacteroidota bacterium]
MRSWWQRVQLRRELRAGPPVVVYQMGKVGSLAVLRSLEAQGVHPVAHAHRLHPSSIRAVDLGIEALNPEAARQRWQERNEGLLLYDEIIARRRPACFITLVREPVGRNVSAFFQNLEVYFPGAVPDEMDVLREGFLERYPHHLPLTWFDDEFAAALDIDVYAKPFPREEGTLRLQRGPFEVLILKAELSDEQKESWIADFLGLDEFTLVRENVGTAKSYGDLYTRFKEEVVLPPAYLDRMAQAKYTRHFYTDEEIDAMVARWSGAASTIEETSS